FAIRSFWAAARNWCCMISITSIEAMMLAKIASGEIETEAKQKKLLDAYAEELSLKRLEWKNIQASVVAGAGFEPAAFRL
ncbi:hypothetical protein ACC722_38930, partial [Rhizobium ruizarguesonis]